MATRIFGSSGIEEQARKDIDTLLSLPQKDADHIVRWLTESKEPLPLSWSEIHRIVENTSLEPSVVDRVLILLRHLLSNWRTFGLTLEDIKKDLASFGYNEEQVNRIGGILHQLQDAKERVYRALLKRSYEVAGLPTIDDVNIVWDLRPVFEEFAYDTEPISNSYENLVSSSYVLLLEVLASRENGHRESATYQLSEEDFERLLGALEKARRQLEIIKKKLLI